MLKGRCEDYGCWVGELANGCKLCMKGLKSVLFLTGLCYDNCFYCPISNYRRNKDVMFINDEEVKTFNDIIKEIEACGSLGVGITGGDPLIKFNELIKVIKKLKKVFGGNFHIHLYTSGKLLNYDKLNKLIDVELDELRIHPITPNFEYIFNMLSKVNEIDVGVEIPALPNADNYIKYLILKSNEAGFKFINLNELEVSESNINNLILRGFKVSSRRFMSVEDSHETALRIMKWAIGKTLKISVHYCPAIFKDRYQYRIRMIRRGLNTKKPYEVITNEGTVLYVKLERSYKGNVAFLSDIKQKENIKDSILINLCEVIENPKLLRKLQNINAVVIEALPNKLRKTLNEIPLKEFKVSDYFIVKC